jgi:hypothetical protein
MGSRAGEAAAAAPSRRGHERDLQSDEATGKRTHRCRLPTTTYAGRKGAALMSAACVRASARCGVLPQRQRCAVPVVSVLPSRHSCARSRARRVAGARRRSPLRSTGVGDFGSGGMGSRVTAGMPTCVVRLAVSNAAPAARPARTKVRRCSFIGFLPSYDGEVLTANTCQRVAGFTSRIDS